jgi:hypothetical protein
MKRRSDEKKSKVSWSASEDDALLKAVLEDNQDREAEGGDAEDEEDWDEIAKSITGKTPVQCLKRYMVINRRKRGESSTEVKSEIESTVNTEPDEETKVSSRDVGKAEAADEHDEGEDEEEKEPKRARKEGDTSMRWPQDDLDLLKKLVENYKDCKLTICVLKQGTIIFVLCVWHTDSSSINLLFHFRSCASLERDSREFFK